MQSRLLERWEVGWRGRDHGRNCWDWPRALWDVGGSHARERQSWPVIVGTAEGTSVSSRLSLHGVGGAAREAQLGLQGSRRGADWWSMS